MKHEDKLLDEDEVLTKDEQVRTHIAEELRKFIGLLESDKEFSTPVGLLVLVPLEDGGYLSAHDGPQTDLVWSMERFKNRLIREFDFYVTEEKLKND